MDWNYAGLLWYDDVFSDFPKLKRLRFARVVFGATSSLFLLNGTIRKHIGNYEYDEAFIEKIGISFYVDNFSRGDTSFEMAMELYKKLRVRFAEGYFNLRKMRTDANLRKLHSETGQNDIKPEKILGVLWDEIDDIIISDFKEIVELSETLSTTKINTFKILAMFFDLIGILQPLVIKLKILFQKGCKEKFDWDELISEELK